MGKLFNRTKRRRLIKQHKSERDKRVCDRIKAILMFDNDYSYTEIADALLVKVKKCVSLSIKLTYTLYFLRPDSPNLNPIERLWKILHEQVTYNRYYPKFTDFTDGILNFFDNIQDHRHLICSRINDNFQSLATA